MCKNVLGSFAPGSLKLETTLSIKNRKEQCTVLYSYEGIQYSNEKERPIATWPSDLLHFHKRNVEGKNVDTEECIQ